MKNNSKGTSYRQFKSIDEHVGFIFILLKKCSLVQTVSRKLIFNNCEK